MRTFVASLLFLSFVALSSGLSCWDTDDKFYAMRATNTINIKQCESGAKSCKKEWYKASSPELSLPTSFHPFSPRLCPGVTSTTSWAATQAALWLRSPWIRLCWGEIGGDINLEKYSGQHQALDLLLRDWLLQLHHPPRSGPHHHRPRPRLLSPPLGLSQSRGWFYD